MTIIITDIDKDVCMSCKRKYPHRITYWKEGEIVAWEGIKEARLIYHCCSCRSLLSKMKALEEKVQKLEDEYNDYEYKLFMRRLETRNILYNA